MRGGFLPPAILCAAFGLALAFLPLRQGLLAAGVAALLALAVSLATISEEWIEPIFVGCWLSVLLSTALLYSAAKAPPTLVIAAAVNTGLWTGAVTSVAGKGLDLIIALPLLLLLLPGRLVIARGWSIALKVLASWLTAVAILATMVSLTPTPGYAPDHME